MLAIFDIDGTICDTQEVEGQCFAQAVENILGTSLRTLDWEQYAETTSVAIVREIVGEGPDALSKENAVEREFVRLLHEARPRHPEEFSPVPGAIAFLTRLQRDCGWTIAIATGAFRAEAEFKLACCGLELDAFPHATSSDRPRRTDTIALAARRAGFAVENAIYFGDAPWDVSAASQLQMSFIGIGRRHARLRELAVRPVFRDFVRGDEILSAMTSTRGTNRLSTV